MKITNVLTPETVVADLAATGREEAIRLLVDVLSKARSVNAEAALKDIAARERTGSTLIPADSRFVAVPHARTSACKQLVMAVGISRDGVPWDGANLANLVVVILGPPETHALYLRVLGRIARLLEAPDFLDSLLQAHSARDVIAGISAAEEPLGEMIAGDGMPTFCVLGAGHGGLAMAAHLALTGCKVNLFNRTDAHIEFVRARGGIDADGPERRCGKTGSRVGHLRNVDGSPFEALSLRWLPCFRHHLRIPLLSRYASHRVMMPASFACASNWSVRNGLPPEAGLTNPFTNESGPHLKFVM